MPRKNDEVWLEKLDVLKVYLQEFGKFPPANVEYLGHKIGQWLRHQMTVADSGTLPEERLEMLNNVHPGWNTHGEEREAANRELLLTSNWKKKVPEDCFPIDEYIHGKDKLFKLLKEGIYDCQSYIKEYGQEEDIQGILGLYAKRIPELDPACGSFYLQALQRYIGVSPTSMLSDPLLTRLFFTHLDFKSADELRFRAVRAMDHLKDSYARLLCMRFGFCGFQAMSFSEIADFVKLPQEKIPELSELEAKAFHQLNHSLSAMSKLYDRSYDRRTILMNEDLDAYTNLTGIEALGLTASSQELFKAGGISTCRDAYRFIHGRAPSYSYALKNPGDPMGRQAIKELLDKMDLCNELISKEVALVPAARVPIRSSLKEKFVLFEKLSACSISIDFLNLSHTTRQYVIGADITTIGQLAALSDKGYGAFLEICGGSHRRADELAGIVDVCKELFAESHSSAITHQTQASFDDSKGTKKPLSGIIQNADSKREAAASDGYGGLGGHGGR